MQADERPGELGADPERLRRRQRIAPPEQLLQRQRHVGRRIDLGTAADVVGQFHDVVERAGAQLADVEQRQLPGLAQDGLLEPGDAGQLALERPVIGEAVPPHDLEGAPDTGHRAGQPDFAVTAATNGAEQFEVGDVRRWMGHAAGGSASIAPGCKGRSRSGQG